MAKAGVASNRTRVAGASDHVDALLGIGVADAVNRRFGPASRNTNSTARSKLQRRLQRQSEQSRLRREGFVLSDRLRRQRASIARMKSGGALSRLVR